MLDDLEVLYIDNRGIELAYALVSECATRPVAPDYPIGIPDEIADAQLEAVARQELRGVPGVWGLYALCP